MKRRIYCITFALYQRNPTVSRLSTARVLKVFFVQRRISTKGWRSRGRHIVAPLFAKLCWLVYDGELL